MARHRVRFGAGLRKDTDLAVAAVTRHREALAYVATSRQTDLALIAGLHETVPGAALGFVADVSFEAQGHPGCPRDFPARDSSTLGIRRVEESPGGYRAQQELGTGYDSGAIHSS